MRESGFYWVRDNEIWTVAYYGAHWKGWWAHGEDGNFNDSDWAEIDERRIERGSEQQRDELVNGLRAKVSELLEQRSREGLDIDKAILSGIVPPRHPMKSRLQMLANHRVLTQQIAAQRDELLTSLDSCQRELAYMIEKHNVQNMEDGSWLYDYQTPCEAQQLIHKAKAAQAGE